VAHGGGRGHFRDFELAYDRFAHFGARPEQPEPTRAKAAYYAALFKLPYLEVASRRPSFAFFNPVLRIVARRKWHPAGGAPDLTVRLANTKP
jgi:hypothetical protein